jgi:hypothetical protein
MIELMLSLLMVLTSLVGCSGAAVTDPPNGSEGLPVTRSDVILTAYEYAAVPWIMREENREGTSCGGGFLSTYPIGPRVGMGYMWGGWDTVPEFLSKIEAGFGTGTGGNVTYENYPIECVTGISCTGLISRAWHLTEKYTLTLPDHPEVPRQMHEIADTIAGADAPTLGMGLLKKGDVFLNNYHTILFVYETKDGFPMVIDSGDRGVSFRKTTWTELSVRGYCAIRYRNIVDEGNPRGTTTNPILIDSDHLPFTHQGNTWDVVSLEFHRYSINQALNEQGPEIVYLLTLETPTTLMLRIMEDSALESDNDLYLLASLEKDAGGTAAQCLARGDDVIIRDFAPGHYYVVVDSGDDMPGRYTFSVEYATGDP